MFPVILELGPLRIYSFGLMMALGFLVATVLTGKELHRRGFDGELASSLVLWAVGGGLVGARLWAIIDDWSGFTADPFGSLLSGAGFTWYGGFIGGLIMVSVAMRRYGLPWLPTADSIAPGMVLGHAIGRVGCLLAGDGDWGTETDLPWGMRFPNAIVGWDYPPDVYVHPAMIYEAIAYTAIFALLWGLRRYDLPAGTMISLYLLLSPIARFCIEIIRINPPLLGSLSEAQVTSIALIAAAAYLLYQRRQGIVSAIRSDPMPAPRGKKRK